MRRIAFPGAIVIGCLVFGCYAWSQCEGNCPERRSITASGIAVVTADADQAVVRATSKVYGPDAKSASVSGDVASKEILQGLSAAGISKDEIDSTSLILQRTQSYELQQFQMGTEERTRRQYTASQGWAIRVKPDQAEDVLKTLIASGAGEDAWIQWTVKDPDALQTRASIVAVGDARSAAQQIAQKMGVRLGRLINVNGAQNQVGCVGPCGSASPAFGMGDATVTMGSYGMGNQPIAVNSRKVEFRARVNVTFAIEDAAAPAH